MSLLPDDASFHERVQVLFSTFRGRGVALSAEDVELVDQWLAAEVPFEVVARGIRLAAERALWDAPDGTGTLRSLKACRRMVDAELTKHLKRAAGKQTKSKAGATPFHLTRHAKLVRALEKLKELHAGLREKTLPAPEDFEGSTRQEHLVLAWLLRTLPFSERLELLRLARAHASGSSRETRNESRRFHRDALTRRRFELKPFW